MAGLDRKKTNSTQTSWEFYIQDNDHWLTTSLRADKPGELYGPDGVTIALRFPKNEPIQILDTKLHDVEGRKLAHVRINSITGWTRISFISKPTTVALTSDTGERHQERQELSVRDAINDAVNANNGMPIIVRSGATKIQNVILCRKNEGRNGYGKERYADLIITMKGGSEVGISMKMNRAPSLLGGGLEALFDIDPSYMKKATNQALKMALNDRRFELGSKTKLTDIFIEFSNKAFLRRAIAGTDKMGGPIGYVFVGESSPTHTFVKGVLAFTGKSKIFSVAQFATTIQKFYIRIRRRDAGQAFTNEVDRKGIPLFFKKPGGLERARFVVDKHAPSSGLLVKLT
jgi:hypothetical protein